MEMAVGDGTGDAPLSCECSQRLGAIFMTEAVRERPLPGLTPHPVYADCVCVCVSKQLEQPRDRATKRQLTTTMQIFMMFNYF